MPQKKSFPSQDVLKPFQGVIANPAETSFLIINPKQIIEVPVEIVVGNNTSNSCDNPALVISLKDFESCFLTCSQLSLLK